MEAFFFPTVGAGTYRLEATEPGFGSYIVNGLVLEPGKRAIVLVATYPATQSNLRWTEAGHAPTTRKNGFLWFDTSCFPAMPKGYFGNRGRT